MPASRLAENTAQAAVAAFLCGAILRRPCSPATKACRAPGTPYSYGPPTTRGMASKLKRGGGEETSHSIVFPRHGFGPALGP